MDVELCMHRLEITATCNVIKYRGENMAVRWVLRNLKYIARLPSEISGIWVYIDNGQIFYFFVRNHRAYRFGKGDLSTFIV